MIPVSVVILLPLFFVMGVGYFAGRTKRIDQHQMAGINRVLVDFTLPAVLFTGTVQTPRDELVQHGPLILALLIAYVVVWLVGNLAGRFLFHNDAGASVLQGTAVAFPNTGFMGVPILVGLFGTASVVTVAIATVLGALLFIPIAVIVLELVERRRRHGPATNLRRLVLPAFVNAARAPLVWAPILGAVFVLLGISLPSELVAMFNLLGSITAGLAMFAAGLSLSAYRLHLNFEIGFNTILKMVVQPVLMLGLVSVLGITGVLGQEGVIMCALPTPVLATILAMRYESYQSQVSSTFVLTSLVLLVTLPVWRIVLG